MNRAEFMAQLKKCLQRLPYDEVKNVVDYYEEYFDDAGAENEDAVIAELGSPAHIASQIIAEFAVKDLAKFEDSTKESTRGSAKKGLSNVWLVILAVFASPIALPLALAVFIVAFALVIAIGAIVFSFGLTGFLLLLSSVLSAVLSIIILAQDFTTTIYFIGYALFAFGLGVVFLKLTAHMWKYSFRWVASLLSNIVLRKTKVEVR